MGDFCRFSRVWMVRIFLLVDHFFGTIAISLRKTMGMGIENIEHKKQEPLWRELIKIAVVVGLAILLVRFFVFKPFYVKGASMEPAYYDHEYLIIDEITYRFNEPVRGDVVVFRPPVNTNDYYIKRVIGLPGETVKVINGDVVIFNNENPQGFKLDESSYLVHRATQEESIVLKLGENEYFVLGDNRPVSSDSRRFGAVDRSAIVGRTYLRGWPLTRLGIVKSTVTYETSQH